MKKNIYELKPHPRNQEFFDDIEGEKWDEFLESISHGVIEPLIITQDDVIVSGHQRVRALKELGKKETVNCIVKEYEDEDAVLLDLIESNIRQRGDVGGSQQKIGRRINELLRLKGVRDGAANPEGTPVATTAEATREDVASMLGMSLSQMERYRKLADAIPELSEALDAGTITQRTALAMMRQLSEEEQIELLSGLDATKKYTERETADLIAEIQELKDRPAEVIETVVEKVPDDYEYLKDMEEKLERANQTIEGMKKDYSQARKDLNARTAERNQLRNKVKSLEEADKGEQVKRHRIETGIMFNSRVTKFIEDVAGYVWLTDEIMELPEKDREVFIRTVEKVRQWAEQMEYNIKTRMEEK